MDNLWHSFIGTGVIYVGSNMTTIFKGYLMIIGLVSMVLGLACMFMPDFSWYPAFEGIERGTAAASFIRTMSGVFVASGYVLIRFIFSSSKVQLGTVLIYLCSFMLLGKFSGTSDESGFIMNHVDINQHSPKLVESVLESLKAIKDNDQEKLNENLKQNFHSMVFVNDRRKDMWVASRWKHYNDFRIFIMGIKGNNEIFDDGLVYQGVWDEPKQYRGQTGAQDNIIPMEDIFSGVINFYPDNQLTKYLLDLRKYRPKCIQNFFVDLKQDIDSIHGGSIFNFLKSSQNSVGMCYLLAIVEEIYKFRNGHWQFVQKYIMSNTKYAKATGGTPIISWIPNQIKSVLNFIEVILHELQSMDKDFDNKQNEFFINSLNTYKSKRKLLDKQLIVVSDANYNPGKVFELNKKFKLEDSNFEKK